MMRCAQPLVAFGETLGTVITALSLRPGSTRPRLKVHMVSCRVRRKRQRLASNGSIESDAVFGYRYAPSVSPASLPIECWRLPTETACFVPVVVASFRLRSGTLALLVLASSSIFGGQFIVQDEISINFEHPHVLGQCPGFDHAGFSY